jgi:hypothetical protein
MMDNRHIQNRMVSGESLRDREGEERFVDPGDLAAYWSVHVNTVYRDIRKGALPALRLPSGRFRIRWTDARRYGRPNE